MSVENVLPQIGNWLRDGQRICLATLVHADGSAPRPRGSQMAIAGNGEFFGYLSGGCAEAAIAEEGLRALRKRRNSAMRFGVGSPYLDIQLPCGAGIDVWFDQSVDAELVDGVLTGLRERRPVAIESCVRDPDRQSQLIDGANATNPPPGWFRRWFRPRRRLYAIGAGPVLASLATLAHASDYEVHALSPDHQSLKALEDTGVAFRHLDDVQRLRELGRDPWTAVVLLFHEHEREEAVLREFLPTDVFYIGALGSPRTQAARIDALHAAGISREQTNRLHGPVGLDILARTPAEIAISILAEMTRVYQRSARPLLAWDGGALHTHAAS